MPELGTIIGLISGKTKALSSAIGNKLDAPETAGTANQVLTSDGNGGQVWAAIGQGDITVDETLSVQGSAADAKKTGDKIASISGTTRNINTAGQGRYRMYSGNIISSNSNYFGLTDYVEIEAEKDYTLGIFNVSASGDISVYIWFYDSSHTQLLQNSDNKVSSNGGYITIASPQSAKYIYFHAYHSSGITITDNSKIQIEKGIMKNPYVVPECAFDDQARSDARECAGNLFGIGVSFTETDGYYSNTGDWTNAGDNKEKTTNFIDLNLVGNVVFNISYSQSRTMWVAVSRFNNSGEFVARKVVINTSKQDGTYLFTPQSGDRYVAFSYRTYNDATVTINGDIKNAGVLDVVRSIEDEENKYYKLPSKPCYDHLFVNNQSTSTITIPHESLFHVRASRSFGFNVIEANVNPTSDGVYIVNHLSSGKFGAYFTHVDGTTDISNTLVSSVTWDWIVSNVRYRSSIPQYRTRPCRLEEFLGECRQQGIIPFISSGRSEVVEIANKYMGKGNFIAYGATRSTCPTEVIYRWLSKTTKAEIVEECEGYGKPFIYGMQNPTSFTDEQLRDIVDTLHKKGYWIGVSYADDKWHKYADMGFDINGSQTRINRIDNGNICNFDTLFGFDDFTFTNATEANGVLTFTADGTIEPNVDNDTLSMCAIDIEISFNGTIVIPVIGENRSAITYTSDGSYPMFAAIPIINGSPKVSLTVSNGTVIYDAKFKASKI